MPAIDKMQGWLAQAQVRRKDADSFNRIASYDVIKASSMIRKMGRRYYYYGAAI
jgi:hypothetical protein